MALRSPNRRILGLLVADVLLINLAALLALALRFSPDPIPASCWRICLAGAVPLTLCRLLCLWRLGLYRIAWRYVGLHDLGSVVKGVTASSVLFGLGLIALGPSGYPRGVLVMDWLLACILLGGLRLWLRAGTVLRAGLRAQRGERRRLLIVGAGDHAEALAREVGRRPDFQYHLVGFLDDDEAKHGLLIHGAPVLGAIDAIEAVVRSRGIQEVIVAIPSASGAQFRRILALCEGLPVRLRTTPGFAALQRAGRSQSAVVRDVAPEDLLRRSAVQLDLPSIAGYLQGERVLITGAGGSIGSELVRQVLRFGPRQVLLLGRGENSIFEVEQELPAEERERVVPLIADARDRERLAQIFAQYRPTVVFHAAAHKHVPLMEANPQEAVKNNVLGARHLLELAGAHRVKRFVLVSTDKAVNPTSVMGATKRIAELMLQAQAQRAPETRFMAVRFGNVLGSRGSVLRTMRSQIQRHAPVTVTHPEMVRFFMTIPEAVQLLIQAGALGRRGEVFVLDMGEPVRILDLARDLIRLSGFVPGEEIPIQFTGIRPGEKLFEELLTTQEGISVTQYEGILVARPPEPDLAALPRQVDELVALACSGAVAEVRRKIAQIVPEYQLPVTAGSADLDAEARPAAPVSDREGPRVHRQPSTSGAGDRPGRKPNVAPGPAV
jgi:FlaA1/EpsC-like NDP-sugar epimerase